MNKALIIFGKDWQEIRQSIGLIATMLMIPLFFTAIAIGYVMLFGSIGSSSSTSGDNFKALAQLHPEWSGYPRGQVIQGIGAVAAQVFLIVIPITITITIASHSIVGEKEQHTLEPLLATPIKTWQLLLGKMLVPLIPGTVAAWVAYAIYVLVLRLIASPLVNNFVVSTPYLILVFLFTPLLTALTVLFSLIISSRVSSARTAQQISSVIFVPLILLFAAQILGVLNINTLASLLVCLVVLLLDGGTLLLATAVFQRETILTRWK